MNAPRIGQTRDGLASAPPVPPDVRAATVNDLDAIRHIHNEAIAEGTFTLDTVPKTADASAAWWSAHDERYAVIVAQDERADVIGWAALNRYSQRSAYDGVADLSIYVARRSRGIGVGSALLGELERAAKRHAFHKIVLFTIAFNQKSQGLYRTFGYREVGTFREQGTLGGRFVDVMAMEKILKPFVLFVCRDNTGASQLAAASLRHLLGDRVDVAYGGTVAAGAPDPSVAATLAEAGIALPPGGLRPIASAQLARADRIISVDCNVAGIARIDDVWSVPDLHDRPADDVRAIRDRVLGQARALAAELMSPPG